MDDIRNGKKVCLYINYTGHGGSNGLSLAICSDGGLFSIEQKAYLFSSFDSVNVVYIHDTCRGFVQSDSFRGGRANFTGVFACPQNALLFQRDIGNLSREVIDWLLKKVYRRRVIIKDALTGWNGKDGKYIVESLVLDKEKAPLYTAGTKFEE